MATVKVKLRFPTVGRKAGEVIELDKAEADRLIENGSASAHKAEQSKKD